MCYNCCDNEVLKRMIETLKKGLTNLKNYLKTNILMSTFIITTLINAWLVRFFTVGNYFAIKPVLADLVVIFVITAFGYFFKPKNQFKYFFLFSILLTSICLINTIYYSNYINFAYVSLLKTASELGDYTNAVTNILELKDFIYFFQIFSLCFVHIQLKRRGYYDRVAEIEKGKVRFLNMVVVALITLGFFISTLTSRDLSRLNKQWDRSAVVMEFGIYVYQVNDLFSSIKTTMNEMFGYDEAFKTFREYYDVKDTSHKSNKYTNLLKGKNVIVIHGESLQSFTMNLKFNDRELTPNLNKMASEGIYFSNFYSQESVGNSSDSEFTSLTSLLPSSSGTVFMNYFNRDYETILKLLGEKGYYTFSMHGNNGSAWNRNTTYKYLGYDDFYYYTKDYEIDETIGFGLSDKSFFRQSVEKIKKIDSENSNWYGTLIMLTNHTPFEIGEHSDYSVDLVTQQPNEETGELQDVVTEWLEGTKVGNYLKSVHYADEAIGELMQELEEANLLDDTVIVLYGDHDCKLKKSEFRKLYDSEYYESVLIDPEYTVGEIDEMTYEINRSVPFIIWSKDIANSKYTKEVKEVMGMIDVMPTLSNMLGLTPKYALGNDIFNTEGNIVVFPSGNWLTNEFYYNSAKQKIAKLDLTNSLKIESVKDYSDYINENDLESTVFKQYVEYCNERTEQLINLSNGIITFDLIKVYESNNELKNT